MRTALVFVALLGLGWAVGCGSTKSDNKDYPRDSPHYAFVQLQKALRAGDAEAAWALYSPAMREDMAAKIRALLDRADDVVERDLGRPKAELAELPALEIYRILIKGSDLQSSLSKDVPSIDDVAGDPEGRVLVHYREADGRKCTQAMDRVDGTWMVGARPSCVSNPR